MARQLCTRTGTDFNVSASSMQLVLLLIKLQICWRERREERRGGKRRAGIFAGIAAIFLPALLTLLQHLSVCRLPNEQQIEKSLELSANFNGFRRDFRLPLCVACGNLLQAVFLLLTQVI